MRKFYQMTLLLIHITLFLQSYYVQAGVLPVPLRFQEQTNWCWAATSQGILNYFGNNPTQCQIVNWALSRSDCCRTPLPAGCNVANSLYATPSNGSIQGILQNFGLIASTGQASVLNATTTITEMNAGHPFVMRWGWTAGGGHFLTTKGFIGSNNNGLMHINDPWNGERVMVYDAVVSDPTHQWTHTLRITGRTMPSINVSVNSNEGPVINATTVTNFNVNITLNPNGHNDWADWWVGYDFNGIRYYLTETGTVTTTPTTWRQAQLSTTNQSVYSGLLPTGTYTMYFAVDLTRNGILDGNVYWDMITVQVN